MAISHARAWNTYRLCFTQDRFLTELETPNKEDDTRYVSFLVCMQRAVTS